MIDSTFLDQLKNLNFIARRKVSSVYIGSRASINQGRGLELYDHREYYTGDDFRAIDWKLYGRTEKMYIRRFEEEKDLTLHMLLDSSASMDFSTAGNMRKFDYAASIAAGFAYVAMNKHEKFAPALYSERLLEVMPASKGKMQFMRLVNLFNDAKQSGATDLGACMNEYASYIKTKSFMIAISDFLEPIDSLRKGIYRIARQSKDAVIVQVLDPGEITLKWTDDIEFLDVETSKSEKAYLSPSFRKDYEKKFREHISSLREICQDTGVNFFPVHTGMPLFDSFVSIIQGRQDKTIFDAKPEAQA